MKPAIHRLVCSACSIAKARPFTCAGCGVVRCCHYCLKHDTEMFLTTCNRCSEPQPKEP